MTPETQVLDAIFSKAMSHDRLCQFHENEMYAKLGDPALGDTELNDYVYSAIQLCAILASAALRRLPVFQVFSKATAGSGTIEALSGDELEDFMGPIFEESGIGHRFEVRNGHEVYRKDVEAP